MKRNTDVSRLRPARVQESAETGTRAAGCAAAVKRATELLAHSMQESETPITELSTALVRMAQTLKDIGTPLFVDADVKPTGDLLALRDAIARDIAVCIECLQFHDRLMQQLTHAHDILTGVSAKIAGTSVVPADDGRVEGSIELF